jgi:hypothetical protein
MDYEDHARSQGNGDDPQDPDVGLARMIADPHAVHALIELLPDPRAIEMLKTWSKVVLDVEEETNTVLWFVLANPRPLRPGRAGFNQMLKRWKDSAPPRGARE